MTLCTDLCDRRTSDLMTKDILTTTAKTTLEAAARRMYEGRVHGLFILPDEPGDAIGIVSRKDIVQVLVHEGEAALADMLVDDVMVKPVITVPHRMRVRDALRLMRMTGVRRAPVMRGDEVIGVFSYSDVIRELVG